MPPSIPIRPRDVRTQAWLRQQITAAAVATETSPLFPLANPTFIKCSKAITLLAEKRQGLPLPFPSRALPPLP